jgi:amino acid transporter
MGNFWGFQEAWLSLIASVFDMAIYPTLFILYLQRLFPWFSEGHRGLMVGLGVVALCALLNVAGVKVVSTTSLWLFFALSAPFVAIVCIAPFKFGALAGAVTKPTNSGIDILTGVLICMWNYMGWDNASTIAAEVKQPQLPIHGRYGCRGDCGRELHRPSGGDADVGSLRRWDTGFWADTAGCWADRFCAWDWRGVA